MAIDTILSNDSLVVVGPPASLTVSTDLGAKGDRGSIFFSGAGAPTSLNTPDSQIGDLYINRALGGNYGTVYSYNAFPGGSAWQPIIKFQPFAFSTNKTVSFSGGVGSVSIPVQDFYENIPEDLLANDLLVQITPEYSLPVFLSVKDKSFQEISSANTFVVGLTGAELDGTVSALSGSVNLNIFITSGVEE
jgi:hypothetical protein